MHSTRSLFIPDGALSEGLTAAVAGAERGADALLARELMLAEAGQVLHKKRVAGVVTLAEPGEIAGGTQSLPIRLSPHHGRMGNACKLAKDYHLTVDDALFLDLAKTHSARLLNVDESLAQAACQLNL